VDGSIYANLKLIKLHIKRYQKRHKNVEPCKRHQ